MSEEQHRGARLAAFAFGGLLLGGLIGGAVVLARDDGADAPTVVDPDAPVAGVVTEDVPLDEIEVGGRGTWTGVQHGDDIVIMDGLATDGRHPADAGADPHLRVWTLSASDPTTATQIDFPDSGPLGFVEAWWWDGRWGIDGYHCPDPWRGDVDDNRAADCGSTAIDVIAVDPSTATARTVAADLEATYPGGRREYLRPVAVNGATTLLSWSDRQLFTLDLDGQLVDIDDLDPEQPSAIRPYRDSFVALTHTGRGRNFGHGNVPHPLNDFITFHRLIGTEWVEEALPPLSTDVIGADLASVDADLAVQYRDPANEPGQRRLVIGDDGTLSWQPWPRDATPPPTPALLLDGNSTLDTECVVTNPGAREEALAHSDGTIAHDPSEHRCHFVIVPL